MKMYQISLSSHDLVYVLSKKLSGQNTPFMHYVCKEAGSVPSITQYNTVMPLLDKS